MTLRRNERFVAEILKKYFVTKYCNVDYKEVKKDPPDIFLNVDGNCIPVEITALDENSLNGSKTVDRGYLTFIKNLRKNFGALIPDDRVVFIHFYHFNNKVSTIDKKFRKYLKFLIENNKLLKNTRFENHIGGVYFKIIVRETLGGNQKIRGLTSSIGMLSKKSRDIAKINSFLFEFNLHEKTKAILIDRISEKSLKCKHIDRPIWLALYDNYYNKFCDFKDNEHKEHYKNLKEEIIDYGIFEKVFVVFQNQDILEIK